MKRWLRNTAYRLGYEIRKAPLRNFKSAPIYDLALHYLLSRRGENLKFIEVGANDGSFADPLRAYIVKYPWTGVLVEPQPDVFNRLRANYAGTESRLSFENVAISRNSQPIPLFRLSANAAKNGQHAASVASSDPRITAMQLGVKSDQLEKIMVPTTTLDDLVAKYGLNDLDILQLDTEGFDWEVLQTLDLRKIRPRLISFEHGHLSPKVIGRMTQHLNEHDYLLNFGGHQSDSVAMRSDFVDG